MTNMSIFHIFSLFGQFLQKIDKDPRRLRKKKQWIARKNGNIKQQNIKQKCDWANLADLCLELIFQYLSFEVNKIK